MDIRLKLYRIIHYLPTDAYNTKKHGDITSRILDDCDKIRTAIFLNFESLFPNFLTLVAVVGYLFYLSWPLALLSFIAAPIFMVTLSFFQKRLRKVSKQLQQNTADLTQMIQESLTNMKILQIYTAENKNIDRFHHIQKRYMKGYIKEIKFKITREQLDAYSQFIIFLIIIWFGGYLALNDYISTSRLLSFFTGVVLLVEPIIILSKIYATTFQVTASIERINQILNDDSLAQAHASTNRKELIFSSITFNDVCFKYPKTNDYVLKSVSFKVNHGDFLGIVGPSGAGKSTIVSLMSKFYLPTEGQILVDGRSIEDIPSYDLRSNIAYVPQESLLFKSSILDNCRIGRVDASIDDVVDALKLANAWEFVQKLPDQLLTKIGTQGLTLSGGQRQRLSIARAIISQPKLLMLDEATSALDSQSEEKIQAAIQSLKGKFTMVIIAHRLSTIKDASSIIVLNSGEVSEVGTHHSLLENKGLYYELLQKQSFGDR